MKYLVLIMMLSSPAYAVSKEPNNQPLYQCKKLYYNGINSTTTKDMMAFASCVHEIRQAEYRKKEEEIWEFLKKNPHYRYPGVALPNGEKKPLHPCWGKDRRLSTENGYSC